MVNAFAKQFFYFGCISFVVPWVAVYWSYYDSVSRSDPGPPDWVSAIVWSLLLLFSCFAMCMVYFIANYDKDNIAYITEMYYIILSLVSKTVLAWQLFFSVIVRSDRDLQQATGQCVSEL